MIIIYIIVLLLLWYLNMMALATLLSGFKRGGKLMVAFIVLASLGISLLDFYIPVIILVAIVLAIIGKIAKII